MGIYNPNAKPYPPNEEKLPRQQIWSRLEPHSYAANPQRSLRAELHDALWMLTRQWQFGELRGEDAGSAVRAHVGLEGVPVSRFGWGESAGPDTRTEAFHAEAPWEAKVEAEAVPFDLKLQASASFAMQRLLRGAAFSDGETSFKRVVAAFPLTRFGDDIDLADLAVEADLALLEGIIFNAARLLSDLKAGKKLSELVKFANPDSDKATTVGVQFRQWCEGVFWQPASAGQTNWDASRMEYRFAQSAPALSGGKNRPVVGTREYFDGTLDWYSFDGLKATNAPSGLSTLAALPNEVTAAKSRQFDVVPTEAQFPGMPASRFWELENGAVNLCNLDLSKSELPKVLLAEFGLVYGNDWLVIPAIAPFGHLNKVTLEVFDVFGQKTTIDPADDTSWGLFGLTVGAGDSAMKGRLLLPQTSTGQLEGEPIEKVLFFPSPVDGVAWGVELTVPGAHGGGQNAAAAWRRWKSRQPVSAPLDEPIAELNFRLAPDFPENWVAFRRVGPVNAGGPNRFERSRLRRAELADPRGVFLTEKKSPFYLIADEVVAEGFQVTRSFQRTRGQDGRVFTWLGRRKQIGQPLPDDQFIYDTTRSE